MTDKARRRILGLMVTVVVFWTILGWRFLTSPETNHLRVFGSFWASGWAAAHHLNPYLAYPLTWRVPIIGPQQHVSRITDLNLSPPALLPLFHLLSFFAPDNAVKVWTVLSGLATFSFEALLLFSGEKHSQKRQFIWLALCPATYDAIVVGQDWTFLAMAALAAWLLLKRDRQIAAGLLIGLVVAAKPNYALWPLFLLFSGQRRVAITAGVVASALSILPVFVYGPGIYAEWLHALSGDPHWVFPTDVSITGFTTLLGHRAVGVVLSAALVLFSCGFVLKWRPSPEASSGIALSIAILASPVAWMHYSLLLVPYLLAFSWDRRITVAACLMLLPTQLALYSIRFPAATVLTHCCYLLPICYFAFRFFRAAGPRGVSAEPGESSVQPCAVPSPVSTF